MSVNGTCAGGGGAGGGVEWPLWKAIRLGEGHHGARPAVAFRERSARPPDLDGDADGEDGFSETSTMTSKKPSRLKSPRVTVGKSSAMGTSKSLRKTLVLKAKDDDREKRWKICNGSDRCTSGRGNDSPGVVEDDGDLNLLAGVPAELP